MRESSCVVTNSQVSDSARYARRREWRHTSDARARHLFGELLLGIVRRRFACLLLVCLVVGCATPNAPALPPLSVAVGNAAITVPVPKGFSPAERVDPAWQPRIEHLTVVGNRSKRLALFVQPNALAASATGKSTPLQRYLTVETLPVKPDAVESPEQFSEMGWYIRMMLELAAVEGWKPRPPIDPASMPYYYQGKYKPGEVPYRDLRLAEMFERSATTFSLATVGEYTALIDGVSRTERVAQATIWLLVRGKAIRLQAASSYRSENDYIWVKAALTDWLRDVREANTP